MNFRSAQGLYTLDDGEYFATLWYHPVAVGTAASGVQHAEGERLVALHKGPGVILDAHRIAKLHALSLGDTEPKIERGH